MKKSTNKWTRFFSWILFLVYLAVISYFLFFSERYGRTEGSGGYRYNLVFFQEIRRFITYRKEIGLEGFIVNIIGNVLAFTPFGFCLPLIRIKKTTFFKVLCLSFLFSLTIESIQLIYQIGIFDVDDLVMNTVGGVLGYLIYKIGTAFMELKKRKRR